MFIKQVVGTDALLLHVTSTDNIYSMENNTCCGYSLNVEKIVTALSRTTTKQGLLAPDIGIVTRNDNIKPHFVGNQRTNIITRYNRSHSFEQPKCPLWRQFEGVW